MRIFGTALVMLTFTVGCFAGQVKEYERMSPDKRKTFAADWLETGKAFQNNKKKQKAINSFRYVTEIYPMGDSAAEARKILADSYGIRIAYNAETVYQNYLKAAEVSAEPLLKLNHLLMALEIKKDKLVLQKVAILYLDAGDAVNSGLYYKMAVEAGLTPEETDTRLKP